MRALPTTTIDQWAVLAAVVDHGGFAQAGKALNRSQSAVSYAVARLQAALGVPLLAIDGRKAVLTPPGRALLLRARSLVRDLTTLESVAESLEQGWEPELRLVVDVAFPRARLLRIIADLQQSCPGTQLALSDVVLSGAEEMILQRSADLVITTRVPPGFLGEWVLDVDFLAVAHPDHPLFQLGREVTAEDLISHVQTVIRDSGSTQPRDEGWLGAARRFTVSSMEASIATVLAGLAYAWLPEHMLEEPLRRGALRRLPLVLGGSRRVALHVVIPNPHRVGPAARLAMVSFHAPRLDPNG